MKISRDALWKGIIEDLFDDFLRFFYPDAIDLFDFDKGFEFLDKELDKLFEESKSKRRRADKLVKVYTHDGKEKWILIHVEVQGYQDPNFVRRMFDYYYRIFEKYGKRIAALVIFTDDHPNFHPTEYVQSFLGTEIRYKFRTYKLLDKKPEDFADTDNPFAIIMETAWHGLKKNRLDDERLYSFKIRLTRRLKELQYPRKRILRIFRFINNYVSFEKPEIKHKFENEVDNTIFKNRKSMGITEEILNDVRRQGAEAERIKARKEFQQKQKITILNLRKKSFSNVEIAEIMSISVVEVEGF